MLGVLLSILWRGVGLLLSVVACVTAMIFPPQEGYAPIEKETVQLSFSVLSDVHMESFTLERFRLFRKGLQDMANAQVPNDALVLNGDNTMNAQVTEYLMLYAHLAAYNKAENTLLAMGNHDINPSQNTIQRALAKHRIFYHSYTDKLLLTPYFSQVINGSYFIVLGSEDEGAGAAAHISTTQLAWLEATMKCAQKTGKPIFIFMHQPFNDMYDLEWKDGGGMGAQSDAVWNIVNQYQNVFFFSGHLHNEVDHFGAQKKDNVWLIDLPSYSETGLHGDDSKRGNGYQVEVYPDRVELRARNFANGEWLEINQYTIALQP